MNESITACAHWAPRSSVSTADEVPLAASVPLWEVPGWRERYGVTAGITGRGPDPAAPFDLGLWTENPVREVMERWRRLRAHFSTHPSLIMSHQVHGDRVQWHGAVQPGWTILEGSDGHATATPGCLLLVTVADCVPVYLVAPRYQAVALLHAGWRGTAASIVARGAEVLRERTGVPSAEIVMHIGVGICGTCYEVGSEVMAAVGRAADGPGPWHLDLRNELQEQADRIGIAAVTVSSRCTACDRAHFFSHRGSGGRDGRMVAYLGWPE
jgi:YfiH family protein